jgi:glyoxylase-like metal-dependent hydrolase (beta-lactamase superfamily II)
MQQSLRERILTLDDDTVVLPGHGQTTTIGRERASNPFLLELGTTPSGPHRGL